MPKIVVKRNGRVELEHVLPATGVTTIGRQADNDVVLADPSVSRRHARIEPEGAGFRIVDLDSGNGILHDGRRVPGLSLVEGSVVELGSYTLEYEHASEHAAAAGSPAKLVLIGGGTQKVHRLTGSETVVGRSSAADVSIDEPLASGRHFQVVARGSVHALVDLGSANGTFVNGVRVREKALAHADQIHVAGLTFYFSEDGSVPEAGSVELIQPEQAPAPASPSSSGAAAPPAASAAPKARSSSPAPASAAASKLPRFVLAGAGLFVLLLFLVAVIVLRSPENRAQEEFQEIFQADLSAEERLRIEEFLTRAEEYESRETWALALEQYRKVLVLDETHQRARSEAARLEEVLERQAAERAQQAREERERLDRVAELAERSDALVAAAKYDEARALLDEARELAPESELVASKIVASHVSEGDALRSRNAGRARAAYAKALELDPANGAAQRGISRIDSGRRQAQQQRQRIEELTERGLAELRQEEYREAYASFSELLQIDPGNARANEFRDQAQELLEQQVRPMYEEGVRLYNAGELAPAMKQLQAVLDRHPDHADTRSFLSNAMDRVRSEAVEIYKRAYIYEGLGRLQEAMELYRETLALLPNPREEYHRKASERIQELSRKIQ